MQFTVLATVVWLLGWGATTRACEVVDAYSAVAQLAADTVGVSPAEQLRVFHEKIVKAFPGLYKSSVLGLPAGAQFDAAVLASLAAAREHPDRMRLAQQLRANIDQTSKAFAVFTDFHCDFPIYVADTLGQLDGAGRVVDERRALVLGVGNLDAERSSISLPALITHELFHRYHYQAAGYSDDLADQQPIWMALWVEGLATYASRALVPGTSVQDALLLPADLEQRAAPLLRPLATDLLLHLDETNRETFTTYFTYGNGDVARRGLPWRSGYYVGFLVARQLAQRHSLDALAHMQGPELHREITIALRRLSS